MISSALMSYNAQGAPRAVVFAQILKISYSDVTPQILNMRSKSKKGLGKVITALILAQGLNRFIT